MAIKAKIVTGRILSLLFALTLVLGVSGLVHTTHAQTLNHFKEQQDGDTPLKTPLADIEELEETEETFRSVLLQFTTVINLVWSPLDAMYYTEHQTMDEEVKPMVPHVPLYISLHTLKIPYSS